MFPKDPCAGTRSAGMSTETALRKVGIFRGLAGAAGRGIPIASLVRAHG